MNPSEVETNGRVVTVNWDGSRNNALGRARYQELEQAARSVSTDQVLLLRSSGPNFCAGQDLHEFASAGAAGRAADELRCGADAMTAVLRCAGPVVVLAQGAAVGAGALLVAAADVAVVTESAWLRLPELEFGLPLGKPIARHLLPAPLVRRMLYMGEYVDGPALASIGAARLVAEDELELVGDDAVRRLLNLEPEALRTARGLWDLEAREAVARAYEREVEACKVLLD